MKKCILAIILVALIVGKGISQPFFQLDSIRHPNCNDLAGHAFFTLFFQSAPGPILVKGMLIPGMEYQTFDAIAQVYDTNGDGTEPYEFSMQAEGDQRLYFVFPALQRIDSADFHFNSHLLNVAGMYLGLTGCDSISMSGISFSQGTPPYRLYMTTDNWANTEFVGSYPNAVPSQQVDVTLPLPQGQYQFKIADTYCEKLYPEPNSGFSAWGIGVFLSAKWISACPEMTGDTLELPSALMEKDITLISGGIMTLWSDTLQLEVNYADGSPVESFTNTAEHWQTPVHLSHIYPTTGIYHAIYTIQNVRVAVQNSSYQNQLSEYVKILNTNSDETALRASDVSIYPNPFATDFNFEVLTDSRVVVYCTDPVGRAISTQNEEPINGKVTGHISLKNQPEGVYFITVTSDGNVRNFIVVKQN